MQRLWSNPNQLGCDFPSKALAGVGVAFYVLANLSSQRKKQGKSAANLTQYLDLVALGTYADVASLDYNNRILVDAGLKRIQQNLCRPGISALLDLAGREPAQLKAQDLGFVLGHVLMLQGAWKPWTLESSVYWQRICKVLMLWHVS